MSSATLTPPPTGTPPSVASAVPRPLALRWTVEQFHHMGSLGWFAGRRPFLLDGVIWEQGPMNPPHGNALELLDTVIRILFGTGWRFRGQLPLRVDDENDPFPDFAVLKGSVKDTPASHPVAAALVIEVADTSLRIDLTEKAERYATAGVTDYWVLDVVNRELYVLRDPAPLPAGLGATAYRDQKKYAPTDRVSPLAAPHASVLVSELLP